MSPEIGNITKELLPFSLSFFVFLLSSQRIAIYDYQYVISSLNMLPRLDFVLNFCHDLTQSISENTTSRDMQYVVIGIRIQRYMTELKQARMYQALMYT